MNRAFKTMLLAGTAALAVQLGAIAAHAGDFEDLIAAQQAAAALDAMTGDSDPISDAVEAAATEAVVDTLLGAGDDD
ncbi:MAG: hypothetical protein Q8K85_09940 [Hyphomicrobium sp.]|jgi:hypothetical protein|nr:hypothetical protein [Hyphomicrobium sp.]